MMRFTPVQIGLTKGVEEKKEMTKPTARKLLDRMSNAEGLAGVLDIPARDLAARVEKVLAECKPGFQADDTPEELAARVVRLLNGEEL